MKFLFSRWKISGFSGIVFVTLSFIASVINKTPPGYDQDSSILSAWFSENSRLYLRGHLIAGFAFILFYFPFFAGLCEILRQAEGGKNIWTRVTWAGAILSPAVGTISGASISCIALLDGNISTDLIRAGMASHFYCFTVSGAFSGMTMIAAAVIILKTRVFKSWLGWTGLLIGTAAIISLGSLLENNPQGIFSVINGFSWMAYFIWIAVVSMEMVRMPE